MNWVGGTTTHNTSSIYKVSNRDYMIPGLFSSLGRVTWRKGRCRLWVFFSGRLAFLSAKFTQWGVPQPWEGVKILYS